MVRTMGRPCVVGRPGRLVVAGIRGFRDKQRACVGRLHTKGAVEIRGPRPAKCLEKWGCCCGCSAFWNGAVLERCRLVARALLDS